MSTIDVKKSFIEPLLFQLNKDTRADVQEQDGQILLFDNVDTFKKVIENVLSVKIPKTVLDGALKLGKQNANKAHDRFTKSKRGKRRLNNFVRRRNSGDILISSKYQLKQNMFLVQSFDSTLKKLKNDIVDYIFEELKVDDKDKKAEANYQIQKGHGEAGFAVSQVQVARTMGRASQLAGGIKELKKGFDAFLMEAKIDESTRNKYLNQVEELSVQYKNMVTKTGKLKAQYFSIITYQAQDDNAADGIMEKKLVTLFRKYINSEYGERIIDMKGSSSIRQKASAHITKRLVNKLLTDKNTRVKIDPTLKDADRESKGKVSTQAKKKNTVVKAAISKGRIPARKSQRKAKKGVSSDPLRLIGVINQKLPETVRRNMNPPALQNQTGRFAESVKLTDVIRTPKGMPSFGYTYQKSPYQRFEVGRGDPPWATPERDPRKLIEQSIREIAAQFAIGRFYTRRV